MSLDTTTELDFPAVAAALEGHSYRYAKTMPQCPHWYTLRKTWADGERGPGELFEQVVMWIREHGYPEKFGRSRFIRLDVNGQKYWSMGAPLHKITEKGFEPVTILINRAVIDRAELYDTMADEYDEMYSSPAAVAESLAAVEAIGYTHGSVLDIGCGTGLLLDFLRPEGYLGVDPSRGMLAVMAGKHPNAETVASRFESFWTQRRFNWIVGLFGAPSYVPDEALRRIPAMLEPGGRVHLVFYAPDYEPVTYQQSGVYVPHFDRTAEEIEALVPGRVTREGNYLVLRSA